MSAIVIEFFKTVGVYDIDSETEFYTILDCYDKFGTDVPLSVMIKDYCEKQLGIRNFNRYEITYF